MRHLKIGAIVLLSLGLIAGGWFGLERWKERRFEQLTSSRRPVASGVEREMESIRQEIIRTDQTIWAMEILSQKYEDTIIALWDELRSATDKFEVLRRFPFEQITVPSVSGWQKGIGGMRSANSTTDRRTWTHSEFLRQLDDWKAAGFELVQCEWYHEKFDAPTNSTPARSVFSFEWHVANRVQQQRLIIEGDLAIEWSGKLNERGQHVAGRVALEKFRIGERTGAAAFDSWPGSKPIPMTFGGTMLLAHDLNGDGLSELMVPTDNALYMNQGNGAFARENLCAQPVTDPQMQEQTISAVVIADLTGDGHADLVLAGSKIGVVLFRGDATGRFPSKSEVIFKPTSSFVNPLSITAGDVNGDQLPDLWVAQFKASAELGSMPSPFWDANDGFRSHLLVNKGGGAFEDQTIEAGLEAKRYRRTYASSLVDLDEDGDLDLLVSSDYAGVDIHFNDGKGHFTDATKTHVDEPHLFGMGHAFADFDGDGRLDFYVTGMDIATVRRLDYMGLERSDHPDHTKMRSVMTYGSRMYLAQPGGGFRQPAFIDQVAHARWAWGCVAFDFANDGFTDLYVANGHISRKTAKSYSPRAWTQEIYLGDSRANLALNTVLSDSQLFPGHSMSFEGFQHNALFVNEGGKGFHNGAFLMDVAFEYDARSAIADDLDGDGRVDLIVSSIDYTKPGQRHGGAIHIYRNVWPTAGNWIGVRLRDEPALSVIGAKITLMTAQGKKIARIVNGDSFNSQQANTKHFGLGQLDRVDTLEVRWQNGAVKTIRNPAINQYHAVSGASR